MDETNSTEISELTNQSIGATPTTGMPQPVNPSETEEARLSKPIYSKDEKVIKRLLDDWQAKLIDCQTAWTDYTYNLIKYYKDFKSNHDFDNYPYDSNLYIPKTFSHIRVLLSRMMKNLLFTQEMISIDPLSYGMIVPSAMPVIEKVARDAERVITKLLKMGGAELSLTRLMLDALWAKRAISKTGWQIRTNDQNNILIEYPVIYRVSPFRYFIDPYAIDQPSARYEIEILRLSKETIINYGKKGVFDKDNVNKIDWDTPKSNLFTLYGTEYIENELSTISGSPTSYTGFTNLQKGYMDVIEINAYEDIGDGKHERCVIDLIPHQRLILRAQKSPFNHGQSPYNIGYVMIDAKDGTSGISLTELMHPVNASYNTYFNQAADNNSLAVNGIWLINRNADIDVEALEASKPWRIVTGENISQDGIRQQPVIPLIQPVFQAVLPFLDRAMDEASGVNDLTQGLQAANTAFATSVLQSQNQENLDLYSFFFTISLLNPMAQKIFENTKQFLDTPIPIKMQNNNEYVYFSNKLLNFDAMVEFGTVVTSAMKRQRIQTYMSLLNVIAQASQSNNPAILGIVKRILALSGEDPDTVFMPQPQMPQQQPTEQPTPEQLKGIPGQNTAMMPPTGPAPEPDISRGQIAMGPEGQLPPDLQNAMMNMMANREEAGSQ